MIQAGFPPKMQAILGHASMTTTLDLYGHLYPGDMGRYADRLEDAAEAADPAKIRQVSQTTTLAQRTQGGELGYVSALGGTRTPNLLIRSNGQRGSAGGVAFPELGDKGLDGGEGEVRPVAEDGVTRPGKSDEAGGAGRQLTG